MVVFNGKRPTDPIELRNILRGIKDDSFVFYDDLSWFEKIQLKHPNISLIIAIILTILIILAKALIY